MNNNISKNLIFSLLPAIAISCNAKEKKEETRPNIIFILADDLGIGDLSCYGQRKFSTPSIDQMASEGMIFSNFYCGSTVSAPSRAALLTGKHTGHTSVRGNLPAQLINDNEVTLAKVLKQAGYVTGCIGKWGIGHPPPPDDPLRKGFDYFYGYVNMWHAHNFYPEFLYRNGEKVFLNNKLALEKNENPWKEFPEGTGVASQRNDYVHYLFDREALDFINRHKDSSFFLYLAYNVPHANNEKKPDGMEVPDYYEFSEREWPIQEKGFAAMIRNLDNSVGKILAELKELGLDEKTIVFFCSDNGPHNEGGHDAEFFNSNGNYRGIKRDLWDGGIRTPFIVKWPGKIKPQSYSDHIAALWDVLPTFCDIAGIKKPVDIDGISFFPTLIGKNQLEKHDYLYWEFYEQGGKQAILKGDYKALRFNVREGNEKLVFELYNIKEDPEEKNNIADKHPELVKEFTNLFTEARKEFAVTSLFNNDNQTVDTPF